MSQTCLVKVLSTPALVSLATSGEIANGDSRVYVDTRNYTIMRQSLTYFTTAGLLTPTWYYHLEISIDKGATWASPFGSAGSLPPSATPVTLKGTTLFGGPGVYEGDYTVFEVGTYGVGNRTANALFRVVAGTTDATLLVHLRSVVLEFHE